MDVKTEHLLQQKGAHHRIGVVRRMAIEGEKYESPGQDQEKQEKDAKRLE